MSQYGKTDCREDKKGRINKEEFFSWERNITSQLFNKKK